LRPGEPQYHEDKEPEGVGRRQCYVAGRFRPAYPKASSPNQKGAT